MDTSTRQAPPCLVNLAAPKHLVVSVRIQTRDAIRNALNDGVETVCVDFANTTVIDSSGWVMLEQMKGEAARAGRRLLLHNFSDDMLELLRTAPAGNLLLEGAA